MIGLSASPSSYAFWRACSKAERMDAASDLQVVSYVGEGEEEE